MCLIGSAVTMRLFRRASQTRGTPRFGWLFQIAVCAGCAIWSTHFIAMLGYRPAAPVTFDPVLTLASLLIAIVGTGVGFAIASAAFDGILPLLGGALVGIAISAMHYTGMFAYRVDGPVAWDQAYVWASLVLAAGCTAAATDAARRWRGGWRGHLATGWLVVAIVGLHFTGMTAFEVTPMPGVEVGANADAFRAMALSVAISLIVIGTGISSSSIDQRTRSESDEQLRHMALHDPLTGLPNRTNFNAYLDRLLSAEQTDGLRVAVAGIDLNRFKEINDLFGHWAGDMALCTLADRLRGFVGDRGYVARLGGDEFSALIRFETDAELRATLQGLEHLMFQPLRFGEAEATAGASIGVAVHPRDGKDRQTLTVNADLAMYRAKSDPDQNICFYDEEMGDAVRDCRSLVSDLRQAIANDTLEVHYQVQTSVATGEVCGYEALLRWTHPERGRISPAEFIPLAETNGLILPLGEWVLRRACRDAAQWEPGRKVAVNVSGMQLSHANLPDLVARVLAETGLPASNLELELTETAVVKDKARSLLLIQMIKGLGVSIALDDFGTGYSSLDTLKTFPFDKIKLDRTFVEGLSSDPRSLAIIRAVLALGRSLRVPVLAEGIETRDQLFLLQAEACNEAQGFLLGRPVPVDQLAEARPAAEASVADRQPERPALRYG